MRSDQRLGFLRRSLLKSPFGPFGLALGMWLLTSQCAQIVTPSGGPKDIKAPRAEKYVPDSAATNFSAKTITIVFNEFIQLADLQKEMTISPPMRVQPEVKVKGKMLIIELNDTLKKNTTYVINFGNSIRDFTESNAKTDFKYIFSTGGMIDTLRMTGVVKNAYDLKTDKGVLVMLYETLGDSVPYKTGPSYFAKTNADGSYKISNIKPGKYKAFALKDANSNYKYDLPSENIGFSDTAVNITKHAKLDFRLFREEPSRQSLLKTLMGGYGRAMLLYARPVSEISYTPLKSSTPTETFITEFNSGRDSIRIWFPVFSKDTLYFKVIADKTIIDTVRIGTAQFKKETGGRGEVFKLAASVNASKDIKLDLNSDLLLKFNHPLRSADTAAVYLTANGQKINYTNKGVADAVKRNYHFRFPVEQDSSYRLFIPPGTFTDIFGLKNDTLKVNFKTQEEKFYGTLKLTLKLRSMAAYVLELVNEKGVVFNYARAERGIFSFLYVPPGAYKLRIIYDQNGDGKWTTGNYLAKRNPETIIYYPGAVTIRSNWDLELDWKVE